MGNKKTHLAAGSGKTPAGDHRSRSHQPFGNIWGDSMPPRSANGFSRTAVKGARPIFRSAISVSRAAVDAMISGTYILRKGKESPKTAARG